ncbi:MAG: hypothetical protein ONB06_02540 [candidate division KSB1 bacterium]|nr:hypothetical protein [candidate division KSB1 bacterium]
MDLRVRVIFASRAKFTPENLKLQALFMLRVATDEKVVQVATDAMW